MNYEDAKNICHVRSAIYRTGDKWKIFSREDLNNIQPGLKSIYQDDIGEKIRKLYWKNHNIPLDERVPDEDKEFDDWEEYDPREEPGSSAYNEMPA